MREREECGSVGWVPDFGLGAQGGLLLKRETWTGDGNFWSRLHMIGNQEGPRTVCQEKRTLRDMNEGEKDNGEVGQRPRRLWDHGWLATRICAQWLPS